MKKVPIGGSNHIICSEESGGSESNGGSHNEGGSRFLNHTEVGAVGAVSNTPDKLGGGLIGHFGGGFFFLFIIHNEPFDGLTESSTGNGGNIIFSFEGEGLFILNHAVFLGDTFGESSDLLFFLGNGDGGDNGGSNKLEHSV